MGNKKAEELAAARRYIARMRQINPDRVLMARLDAMEEELEAEEAEHGRRPAHA